ncbi:MAG: hypothetical protein AMXMBFR7_50120 [Planctomycetota bacterium]
MRSYLRFARVPIAMTWLCACLQGSGFELGAEAPKTVVAAWFGPEPTPTPGDRPVIELRILLGRLESKASNAILREMSSRHGAWPLTRMEAICPDSEDEIRAFLARQEKPLGFRLGRDDGRVRGAWQIAWGGTQGGGSNLTKSGTPYATLVVGGRVLWHGHPLDLNLDWALARANAGTLDLQSARGVMGFQASLMRYLALCAAKDVQAQDASTAGRRLLEAAADNEGCHFQITSGIVESPDLSIRDLDLALTAIQSALRLGGGRNPLAWSMKARVLHLRGQQDEAVVALKSGIACCEDSRLLEALREELNSYSKTPPGTTQK